MAVQRIVLTFKPDGHELRVLYRSEAQDGPNPGTKARAREVSGLVRTGLEQALAALEGDVTMAGTSGFTQREDVLLARRSHSSDERKLVKGAAV